MWSRFPLRHGQLLVSITLNRSTSTSILCLSLSCAISWLVGCRQKRLVKNRSIVAVAVTAVVAGNPTSGTCLACWQIALQQQQLLLLLPRLHHPFYTIFLFLTNCLSCRTWLFWCMASQVEREKELGRKLKGYPVNELLTFTRIERKISIF